MHIRLTPIHRLAIVLYAELLHCNLAHAWSECGHHVIAEIAYDLLDETEQAMLLATLAEHPRYAQDFAPPVKVHNVPRWRVGRAGYWPDVARGQPKYNRPSWHYQLGATLVIGDAAAVNVPADPGPLPADATLDTQELHIVQTIELCQKLLADKSQPPGDRAIALCWLAHLVADSHQPCHAGSIYVAGVFPDGIRGANSIKTQAGNLHSLWDGLLGRRFDEGDVPRRRLEIIGNEMFTVRAEKIAREMQPTTWIFESRESAKLLVYTTEVLGPIRAVSNGLADTPAFSAARVIALPRLVVSYFLRRIRLGLRLQLLPGLLPQLIGVLRFSCRSARR